jgi:segregation and condensation protein A
MCTTSQSGKRLDITRDTLRDEGKQALVRRTTSGQVLQGWFDMATAYSVALPIFEGPLDLLLHLIEKRELDVTKVSLAAVTDQYLDHISRLEKLESEKLADFLTVAARLLLIKSRMLLPQLPPEEAQEEEDVGDELVRQLIEYRRFRAVAEELKAREEQGLRAYARLLPLPELERSFQLEGVTLDSLVEAVRHALLAQSMPSVDDVVTPFYVSLPEKIAQLEGIVVKRGRLSFNQLLARAASRTEIIVTFLALLQLIKRRIVTVEQDEVFGEIVVSAAD